MQRTLMINALLAFLLANLSLCQAAVTNATTTWSTTVTTKMSSKSTSRKVTYSSPTKNTLKSSTASQIHSSTKSIIKKIGNGTNDQNCVLYLRQQRRVKLPDQNLTTYASKVSIINSSDPHEKCVAIIKTPGRNASIGHLAEVTGLEHKDGKVTMRLLEANNPNRGYYERTITGKNLQEIQKYADIVGYHVEHLEP